LFELWKQTLGFLPNSESEEMNNIDLALEQIESGDYQLGLDTIWADIESGSDEARVALAYKFGAVGLHVFAQDQWVYLLEQGSTFIQEATFGAFGNAVWMRQYAQAGVLLETNAKLKAEYGTYLADSYRDFCTLSFGVASFGEGIGQLLQDDLVLENRRLQRQTLDVMRNQLMVREHLFNIACDLAFNPPGLQGQIALEVPVAGGLTVSRPAIQAVGSPLDRANNLLTTIALTIAMFAERGNFNADEHFLYATRVGKSISNKILLLLDGEDLTDHTSQGIEHVCWALGQSDSIDEQFAGFVLGGATND
jgi:hypothetical protein